MKESSPSSLKPDVQYLRPIAAACQDIAALGDDTAVGVPVKVGPVQIIWASFCPNTTSIVNTIYIQGAFFYCSAQKTTKLDLREEDAKWLQARLPSLPRLSLQAWNSLP